MSSDEYTDLHGGNLLESKKQTLRKPPNLRFGQMIVSNQINAVHNEHLLEDLTKALLDCLC